MQHTVPRVDFDVPSGTHFDSNVSPDSLPAPVPAAQQWMGTTLGRVVADPYSWMQAVHWVHGAGLHKRVNVTTVRLAQILAELSPCRPGVEYLMRRLNLSERAVQYHLAALRETGLLIYISRGTRCRGSRPQASVFARTVPVAFDVALGIRCTPEGPTRRVVGIAEHGRKLIAALGKKAARKVRKPRSKTAPKPGARCTPMEGGSELPSPSHSPTSVPLEGAEPHNPPTTDSSRQGRLNPVGRRFQVAREIRSRILWLARTPIRRIAWLLKDVADAGWTVDHVEAWLLQRDGAADIRRPSGFLGARMVGATTIWPTEAQRNRAWEATREQVSAMARRRAQVAEQPLAAPGRSALAAGVLASLRRGQVAQSTRVRAQGLDDRSGLFALPLTEADLHDEAAAAARIAAFLEGDEL
jgi:DNA-binding transcriptional ArsR family regulator